MNPKRFLPLIALSLLFCTKTEECDMWTCSRNEYAIGAFQQLRPGDILTAIDTLKSGDLIIELVVSRFSALAAEGEASGSALDCASCTALLKNEKLVSNLGIVSGVDTIMAGVNLMDPAVAVKLGMSGEGSLRMKPGVKLQTGNHTFTFAGDLKLNGEQLASIRDTFELYVDPTAGY